MKWRSIFFGVGERGAFVQILGGHRIGGDSLHDGKGEVQQGAGVEDVGLCWSDAGAVVVGADEEAVDDFGEEAIGQLACAPSLEVSTSSMARQTRRPCSMTGTS